MSISKLSLYNLLLLLTLCGPAAAAVFPPLVPEGEQLANSPAELEALFQTLSRRSAILSIAFSPDGQTVATGNDDGSISLWEVATGRARLEGHSSAVMSVAYSPDGKTLASGSRDNTVRVWEVATGQARTMEGHTSTVTSVAPRREDVGLGVCG